MAFVQSFFGILALITSLVGLLPQSIKAFKTRSTRDISMGMLLNFLVCSAAWIVYGSFIHSGFVVFSNILGLATCLVLVFQKLHYDGS